jgi:hypothetical protein
MLLRRPELDEILSAGLINSGYIDLWRVDVKANPWRYEEVAFAKAKLPTGRREEEIASAAESIRRFTLMRAQYAALQQQYPRKYFTLQRELYETLIALHIKRQAVMRG